MKTKFLLLLLLLSFGIYGQNPTKFEKIKITANTQDNGVARILVQDATTGEVKWILKSILDGKFNQPTGNATQYLDGAGTPTTFPTLNQSDRVVAEIRNQTGETVTKGTVVYLNGASGGKALIQKAQANAESTSSGTFGVIQSDINNNSNGFAVIIGTVTGLNTSAYTAGNVLWLSPTVAGTFTTTKPSAPNHAVYVGIVTASSTTQGTIEVKIQNGYELDELHDVSIVSKTNNDALIYDSATGLWKNKQFVNDAIVDGTTTVAPSQNAVFDALATKEPTIASGTTSQYYRGDKTWQTLDKTAVGLGNVDNTSDLNKPISTATQTALNLKENTANKNTANGYAGLGSDGKLISSQLPAITITDTFVVGSQAAMLALTAETGDVAVRTDVNKSFILKEENPAVLSDWQELLTPTSAVTSVFGRNGAVTAQNGDYTTALVTETTNKRYQTDIQQAYNDATSSIQSQLNAKEPSISAPGTTGSYWRGNKTWATLDTSVIPENGSLFFTNDRAKIAVTGNSGSINYVSKFTSNGTIGISQIFDNGTNVGIGTASPSVASGLGLVLNGQAGQTRLAFKNNYTGDTSSDGVQFALIGGSSGFLFQNRESDGYFSFETNGNEAIRITPAGNIGISTPTPSYKFDLNSPGGAISFKAYTSTTNNSEHNYSKDAGFFIDSYQSVGGSPYTKVTDLIANADAGADSKLRFFTSTTASNPAVRMTIGSDGAMGFNYPVLGSRSFMFRGISGRPLVLETAEETGVHSLYLRPNTTGRHLISSNYLSGGVYLPLSLSGRENDSDFVLNTNGNVGIGTTGTDQKLTVNDGATNEIASFRGASNSVSYQILGNVNVGDYWRGVFTGHNIVTNATTGKPSLRTAGFRASAIGYSADSGQGYMGFFTTNSTTANTDLSERMRITEGGNVGIGTTTPSEKLQVAGNVLATGFFQSSDLCLKDIISRDGDLIKYKWKDKRDDKIHIGYVAQEVQKENPDQVNADEKGILSVNYIEILVQKIKDLENRIKQLEK